MMRLSLGLWMGALTRLLAIWLSGLSGVTFRLRLRVRGLGLRLRLRMQLLLRRRLRRLRVGALLRLPGASVLAILWLRLSGSVGLGMRMRRGDAGRCIGSGLGLCVRWRRLRRPMRLRRRRSRGQRRVHARQRRAGKRRNFAAGSRA